MDAGLPQAEESGADECTRVACILTFYHACTGAVARTRAHNIETSSPTRASEDRVRAPRSTHQLLKRPWNWRDLFLSGSTAHRCANIATTQATVRPAHGAAIVSGGERDQDSVGGEYSGRFFRQLPSQRRLGVSLGNRSSPEHMASS